MKKAPIILMTLFCLTGYAQNQASMTKSATEAYQKTDRALNEVYNAILAAYEADPLFIKNLKTSQRLWIQFRDAEVKVKYPEIKSDFYGSSHSMCVSLYLEQLTQARVKTLQTWMNGVEEGDICSGSVKNGMSQQKDKYLIQANSFYGISTGAAIAKNRKVLEKGILQTGEGDFEVFYIKNEKGTILGEVSPDPREESKVGTITITTPLAKTAQGVHVGMTFGELEKILGPVEVHGSEIEGRTHASQDNVWYLLDEYFWTYELDKNEIKKSSKIKEIIIRK